MHVTLEIEGEEHEVTLVREGEVIKVTIGGETYETRASEGGLVTLGHQRHQVELDERHATIDGRHVGYRIVHVAAGGEAGGKSGGRGARVRPPMPGKIVSVAVNEGDEVKQGQVLVILEAMKMQNEIPAPAAGIVKKVHVKPGQNVEGKDVLVELE